MLRRPWEDSASTIAVLSGFQLRSSRDVPGDDHGLMELTHLHGHGKPLQQATSAITDDGPDLPSDGLQSLNPVLVRCNRFVREELPEEILLPMRASPDHDAEEPLEVRGIHDDDDLVGCEFLLLDHDILQLSLYPLRAASVLLCDLCVRLFAVGELPPDFFGVFLLPLTALLAARRALPNLPIVVCAVLLEGAAIATRTYFS